MTLKLQFTVASNKKKLEAKIKRHPDVESSPINVTKYGDWICAEKKCNYGTQCFNIFRILTKKIREIIRGIFSERKYHSTILRATKMIY